MTTVHESDASEDFDLGVLFQAIFRQWKLIILAGVISASVAFGYVTFFVKPTFTAVTQLMPPQQPQSNAAALLGSLAGNVGSAGLPGIKNPADQWLGLLRSQTVATAIVEKFDLMKVYDVPLKTLARNQLAQRSVIMVGKEGLIRVEVDDHDPKRAADLANAYVKQLQLLTKNLALSEASQRRMYFERLMREAKDNLINAEVALRSGEINQNLLRASPERVSQGMAQLQAQISAQEVRIANIETYAANGAAVLKQARAELSALNKQFNELSRSQPDVGGNNKRDDYISGYRDFKYYEALFEIMAKQYEMARADEARQGVALQVVDVATPPERKSKPNRSIITASAGLAGLLLAGLWVIFGSKRVDAPSSV